MTLKRRHPDLLGRFNTHFAGQPGFLILTTQARDLNLLSNIIFNGKKLQSREYREIYIGLNRL